MEGREKDCINFLPGFITALLACTNSACMHALAMAYTPINQQLFTWELYRCIYGPWGGMVYTSANIPWVALLQLMALTGTDLGFYRNGDLID